MRFLRFHGRVEAADLLTPIVREVLGKTKRVIIFSIPRGGVPVGVTVAKNLEVPHDVVITRKISEEVREQWAIGAVAESGEAIWDEKKKKKERPEYVESELKKQISEAKRRRKLFRGRRKLVDIKGMTVVLADDGIATGWTLCAAVLALKARGAKKVIVAAPVSSHVGKRLLETVASKVVVYYLPKNFKAVGNYYHWFAQVTDSHVKKLLAKK